MGKSGKSASNIETSSQINEPGESLEVQKNELKNSEVISLSIVQELMKTQLACFNQIVDNLSKKVDNIMCDVQHLKTSFNFTNLDHEERFKKVTKDIETIKLDISNSKVSNYEERSEIK